MTLKELMLQMGSKNGRFDPCAPEWYMRLSASKDPVERIMGWMQYHTVRFPIRSPYACDQDGNPLTLKHLAADYNWSTRMAQKYWMRATAKHYVKKVEGKLYLRADFKVKGLIVDEDGSSTNVVSIDPTEAYMDSLAPYLREQVAKLPAARHRYRRRHVPAPEAREARACSPHHCAGESSPQRQPRREASVDARQAKLLPRPAIARSKRHPGHPRKADHRREPAHG